MGVVVVSVLFVTLNAAVTEVVPQPLISNLAFGKRVPMPELLHCENAKWLKVSPIDNSKNLFFICGMVLFSV
jgi:hypothetical protein